MAAVSRWFGVFLRTDGWLFCAGCGEPGARDQRHNQDREDR